MAGFGWTTYTLAGGILNSIIHATSILTLVFSLPFGGICPFYAPAFRQLCNWLKFAFQVPTTMSIGKIIGADVSLKKWFLPHGAPRGSSSARAQAFCDVKLRPQVASHFHFHPAVYLERGRDTWLPLLNS